MVKINQIYRRFEQIDYGQAKNDVVQFIRNPEALDLWSKGFFQTITDNLTATQPAPPKKARTS